MNKIQTLLCLTIGSVATAVIYNPPVQAWDLATGFTDMMNGIHDSLAPARTEAQTPLPVPQEQPPIGNSASIQPCAAPPPLPVAAVPDPEGMPPESRFSAANLPEPVASIQPIQSVQPVQPTTASSWTTSSPAIKHYKDPIARILMNTAPGNKMSSLLNRVSYPRRFDDKANYWETDDGTIAVTNDENDRVTAIWMVK